MNNCKPKPSGHTTFEGVGFAKTRRDLTERRGELIRLRGSSLGLRCARCDQGGERRWVAVRTRLENRQPLSYWQVPQEIRRGPLRWGDVEADRQSEASGHAGCTGYLRSSLAGHAKLITRKVYTAINRKCSVTVIHGTLPRHPSSPCFRAGMYVNQDPPPILSVSMAPKNTVDPGIARVRSRRHREYLFCDGYHRPSVINLKYLQHWPARRHHLCPPPRLPQSTAQLTLYGGSKLPTHSATNTLGHVSTEAFRHSQNSA